MRFSCDLFHFSVGETCCHWGLPVPAATAAVSRRRDEHARVPRALLAAVRPAVPCGALCVVGHQRGAPPRAAACRCCAVLCCVALRAGARLRFAFLLHPCNNRRVPAVYASSAAPLALEALSACAVERVRAPSPVRVSAGPAASPFYAHVVPRPKYRGRRTQLCVSVCVFAAAPPRARTAHVPSRGHRRAALGDAPSHPASGRGPRPLPRRAPAAPPVRHRARPRGRRWRRAPRGGRRPPVP